MRILSLLFLLLPLSLFATDSPEVPKVTGPSAPTSPFDEDGAEEDDDTVYYQSEFKEAVLIIEGDDFGVSGLIEFETNYTFTVSNSDGVQFQLYLDDVEKIKIVSYSAWQYSGNIYCFEPSVYRINEKYIYEGNLEEFNVFSLDNGENYFTIYYDQWLEDSSGYFYWKNSRAYDFSYNFDHSYTGVVTEISITDFD